MVPGDVRKLEATHHRVDGSTYPVEVWVNPIETDEDGQRITDEKYLSVARDVSERHDRITLLEVLDRVLRHNVRNELSVIRGRVESLTAGTGDEQIDVRQARNQLSSLLPACDRLIETVTKEREIVDLVGKQPEATDLDAEDLLGQVVERTRAQFPEAEISLDGSAPRPLEAIPELKRAIAELLENAIQHNDRERPSLSVRVDQTETSTDIEIRDDGPAIPEADVAVLEDSAIEPLYHGSGMGLWLVQWIVKLSDGRVEFVERESRGNTVKLHLPTGPHPAG
jgi:signal transduction histidine kinase